jgi:hypothetical protein
MVEETLSQKQEVSPQGQERTVMVNTWLTKSSLRNCAYMEQLNVDILERAREALMTAKEIKRVYDWKHYCGEKPRYWYISIRDDGTIIFEGGTVWHAEVKRDVFYTDGCTTRGLLIDVIDEGITHARTLKCIKNVS